MIYNEMTYEHVMGWDVNYSLTIQSRGVFAFNHTLLAISMLNNLLDQEGVMI
jgi:hypothetical protein